MKKRISCKALIFDMDGTIVDTNIIWDIATQKLLVSKGVSYTPEIHTTVRELLMGGAGGLRLGCALLKQMFDLPDTAEQLAFEKKAHAHELYKNGVAFIEGFSEFHKKIAHMPTAIATNADDRTLEITNCALNLDTYFGKHIYGISRVNHLGKPRPDIYLHAAEQLGIDPRDCVAIEDSATGIKAAQAAGMHCIGINTHGSRELIALADTIVDGYHEIDFLDIF
ncbi:MAG: HAD family phosphatase [Candidatus Babeliaceae bacterium]|nr:HAD family phosphatase [Candidatus Babeliaceae bacterium]